MTAPVIENWFTQDSGSPRLLGTCCEACGTYHFPPQRVFCRNPDCDSDAFEDVELSSAGRLWSFTDACYAPPPPYVYDEPFEPYAIAAVELEDERMVVLGQVIRGVGIDDLAIGMDMTLALEAIPGNDGERLTWKWQPATGEA